MIYTYSQYISFFIEIGLCEGGGCLMDDVSCSFDYRDEGRGEHGWELEIERAKMINFIRF